MSPRFPFDNSYARLGSQFFVRIDPAPVAAPALIQLNRSLAVELGLDPDALASPAGVAILAGNRVPDGAQPLAMAYAGHQFGNFVPQLGDGRAILLGEVVDRNDVRRDIQLKGSGLTAFSRRGDGRAALGPVLREYLVSETMAAYGIPTTRALAAVATGEAVMREGPIPGAVLTRVAASHVRIGTFQFFAARQDTRSLRLLADYVIARHFPDAALSAHPYRSLLDGVIARQASLIAQWLLVGFIHGVMNTDNMSVAGETIDFGPCAFLDQFDPEAVFSSIDAGGRYAYDNQSRIALWNLTRLAECLLPLLSDDPQQAVDHANRALETYSPAFNAAYLDGMRRKLGLLRAHDGDLDLAGDLTAVLAANRADFTLTFKRLTDAVTGDPSSVRQSFDDPAAFDAWAIRWRARLAQEDDEDPARRQAVMRRANPVLIPRNHRIEAAIRAAVDRGDFAPFHHLRTALERPFDDDPAFAPYQTPPRPEERVLETFCGT